MVPVVKKMKRSSNGVVEKALDNSAGAPGVQLKYFYGCIR